MVLQKKHILFKKIILCLKINRIVKRQAQDIGGIYMQGQGINRMN